MGLHLIITASCLQNGIVLEWKSVHLCLNSGNKGVLEKLLWGVYSLVKMLGKFMVECPLIIEAAG